jgi:twitching motility protein PilI
MANKEALRELQGRLAQRLQSARNEAAQRSWLAVEVAGRGFLLPLNQAGEIFPMSPILAVPHTRPWFLGVANLRGALVGVVDLAAFLGIGADSKDRSDARLVGLNPNLDINCAVLIDRLAGLRNEAALQVEAAPAGGRPGFAGGRFRDAAGRAWQELQLGALAADPAFRQIAA